MSFKVLVTGSRFLTDYQEVYDQLDKVWQVHYPLIVIHGVAKGADSFADTWAVFRPNVTVVRVPADWENDGIPEAGMIRNRRMLELGPDLVLAFLQEGAANKGTSGMIKEARSAGIPVEVFTCT